MSQFFFFGVGGEFTVIYVNVFLHESQPRVTAGWFFIPSTKAAIIIVVSRSPTPPPQLHLLFVRLLLALLN